MISLIMGRDIIYFSVNDAESKEFMIDFLLVKSKTSSGLVNCRHGFYFWGDYCGVAAVRMNSLFSIIFLDKIIIYFNQKLNSFINAFLLKHKYNLITCFSVLFNRSHPSYLSLLLCFPNLLLATLSNCYAPHNSLNSLLVLIKLLLYLGSSASSIS